MRLFVAKERWFDQGRRAHLDLIGLVDGILVEQFLQSEEPEHFVRVGVFGLVGVGCIRSSNGVVERAFEADCALCCFGVAGVGFRNRLQEVVAGGARFGNGIGSEISAAVEVFVFQVVTVLVGRFALVFGSVESEGPVAVEFVGGFVGTDFEFFGSGGRRVAVVGRNCEESEIGRAHV